jgi:hypothetical protein
MAMGEPNMIVYIKNRRVSSSVQGAEKPGVYLATICTSVQALTSPKEMAVRQ